MTVFTIGYEGLSIAEFTALLAEHGVETVVDVRELPLSRKPGFSKKSLASVLSLAGIGYVHMSDLGCPRPVRDCYREDGNWQRYTKGFLQHLAAQQPAIAELAELAKKSTCALVCYEADYNFCHRSMVASAVHEHSGARIKHIQSAKTKRVTAAAPQPAFA